MNVRRAVLLYVMPGILVVVALLFVVALLLVKVMWGWTVPDLFPRAVAEGYVAESISWFTALKLAIFIAVLGFFVSGVRGGSK